MLTMQITNRARPTAEQRREAIMRHLGELIVFPVQLRAPVRLGVLMQQFPGSRFETQVIPFATELGYPLCTRVAKVVSLDLDD